ncbi:hypothetical protein H6G97_01305 [Nostoc flagelliforme FACHB-838]|uniref:Uncharacterized protein n=1 Tax=Nostoc flagelliforme FACHB-838 TaxID=2692904 RepID=A0ABR8DFV4_9NOSO|nr:hypothetical protein [Nostoc flagelliforme]MBD2528261.1 hypothetical protein [Nostoc flagelliforme FACHB-838]
MWEPDNQTLLMLLIIIITPCLLGGVFAGIATLIITRKVNFFIETFRLLIGAIGGYEGLVVWGIFNLKDKSPNKILKVIIYAHQNFTGFFIPGMLGAIGASIAIFMMRKVFRWRS